SSSMTVISLVISFFFQAEDGIRDRNVTGVQTCALPIFLHEAEHAAMSRLTNWDDDATVKDLWQTGALPITVAPLFPGLNLKLDDLDNVDALDILVKLGHTLLLTNIRAPITAVSGLGELTSLAAGRLADNPYARQQWTRHRNMFRGARETANGANWGRFSKLGRSAGRTLPGLDVGINFATAYDD